MAEAVQPGEPVTVLMLDTLVQKVVVVRLHSTFHVRTPGDVPLLYADDEEGVYWIRGHHAADSTAANWAARALAR